MNIINSGNDLETRWDVRDASGRIRLEVVSEKIENAVKAGSMSKIGENDLRYIKLKDVDMSDLDLANIDFTGAILEGVNFSKSRLKGCVFIQADISNCDFLDADLSYADLSSCIAHKTDFGTADLTRTKFFDAHMEESTLSRAVMYEADFRAAHLDRSRVRDADMTNALFTRASLQEVDLEGTNVTGAMLDNADFRKATIKGIRGYLNAFWIGSDIRGVDFHGAYLIRSHIMDENYLFEFRNQSPAHEWIYRLWWLTSDCGRSLFRWAACVGIISLVFAVIYEFVEVDLGVHKDSWFATLYFSWITLTTLGYGDIHPVSIAAEIITTIQVILGYCGLGGLMSIFANKMARRAE